MEAAARSGKAEKKARSERLGAIASHDLRAQCWIVMAERPASPNELSRMLKEPLAKVAYHVRELRDAGVIELVDTAPRRGSTEHWYRSVELPLIDEDGTAVRSVDQRNAYARFTFQREIADAELSLNDGIFGERHDHWITRFPLQIDEAGWDELRDAYDVLTKRILSMKEAVAKRAAEGDKTETLRVSAFATFFEMPDKSPTD